MKKPRNTGRLVSGIAIIAGLVSSSVGFSATQPEWRCSPSTTASAATQGQTARFTLKPSHRGDGTWIAIIDECPLNSSYPCGGIQALVDPEPSGDRAENQAENEEGWVNYYQHGFPRKIASIGIVEKPDGTHDGRLFTTQGAETDGFSCVAEYTISENHPRE